VKRALAAVLHEQAPKESTLRTLLAKIEIILNSRPITHVGASPEDKEALTPNHFLLGGSNAISPPGEFVEHSQISVKNWTSAQ
jgi:hypothetical protein